MRIFIGPAFKKFYERLPKRIKERTDETIALLAENPRHPSLHTKKMKGPENVWEVRVTISYRLTFTWEKDCVILRKVGTHDILEREE